MAKRFFWLLVAVVSLMVTVGLTGCGRRTTMPPVVVTQTSLQSDSLVRSLFSLIAGTSKEVRRDSFIHMERYVEKTTVNENGDTLRHDTRTESTTQQYQALEKENKALRMRIDSLERVKNRVDSVPVPYRVEVSVPVERELTWWQRIRLKAFFPLVICVAALIAWSFLRRKFNFNK